MPSTASAPTSCATLLDAHEERYADEADAHADEPEATDALRRVDADREHDREDRRSRLDHRRQPRVDPRLARTPSSQYGTALLSVPRTTNGTHIRRTSGKAPRATDDRHEHREADEEPAEDDDRRLELLHAELDEEERRAPDRREREQEGEVAAMHRATLAVGLQPEPPGRLAS